MSEIVVSVVNINMQLWPYILFQTTGLAPIPN